MAKHMRTVSVPAPMAAALASLDIAWSTSIVVTPDLHVEVDGAGNLVTGSLKLSGDVSLRASRDRIRMLTPPMPATIAMALAGRHVSAIVDHPFLSDPRLIVTAVQEDGDRMSITLAPSPTCHQNRTAD